MNHYLKRCTSEKKAWALHFTFTVWEAPVSRNMLIGCRRVLAPNPVVTLFVSFLLFRGDKYNHTIFFFCVQNGWAGEHWSSLRKCYGHNHDLLDFKSELKIIVFLLTRFYTKTRHGAAITVWYFTFVKKTDPTYIWKMNPREHIVGPPFFCQKTLILCFENIISPSKHTYRCWNWVTSPLAANTSCCLTRGSFVIYAK
jgi:hypothetical protein